MRILFFGLPGSGKTTLATVVAAHLRRPWWRKVFLGPVIHINADEIRKRFDDWDFTDAGRLRQAHRMRTIADQWLTRETLSARCVIADFVAPLPEYRKIFEGHFVVYMDTICEGRFADTNKVWTPPAPTEFDYRITTHRDVNEEAAYVCRLIADRERV